MNALIGNAGDFSTNGVNANDPDYRQFFKITQIPQPTEIFVFLDEHPDSIDDGYFVNREGSEDSYTPADTASAILAGPIYRHLIMPTQPLSPLQTGTVPSIAGGMAARFRHRHRMPPICPFTSLPLLRMPLLTSTG